MISNNRGVCQVDNTIMPNFERWADTLGLDNLDNPAQAFKNVQQALQQAFNQGIAYGVRQAVTTDKWEGVF